MASTWRKRLVSRLPSMRSRVRVSVTPHGFRGGRNGVLVGFFSFLLPQISFHYFFTLISIISFHFISPPLWSRGNIVASHLADPGSIPDRVNFPDWGFFRCFSSTVRQISGKLRPQPSPVIIDHHHKKIVHYGRQWAKMLTRPKTQIIIIVSARFQKRFRGQCRFQVIISP